MNPIETTTTLGRLAAQVRSKNAGPFWLTIDIFLASEEDYRRAIASPVTDPATAAERYGIPVDSVRVFMLADLLAIKISFPRPTEQGSRNDRDMHAGQQFVAMLDVPVP